MKLTHALALTALAASLSACVVPAQDYGYNQPQPAYGYDRQYDDHHHDDDEYRRAAPPPAPVYRPAPAPVYRPAPPPAPRPMPPRREHDDDEHEHEHRAAPAARPAPPPPQPKRNCGAYTPNTPEWRHCMTRPY